MQTWTDLGPDANGAKEATNILLPLCLARGSRPRHDRASGSKTPLVRGATWKDVDQQASCRPPRPRTAPTPPPPPLASQAVSTGLCLGLLRGCTWRSLDTSVDINRPRRYPPAYDVVVHTSAGRTHIFARHSPPLFFCPRTHALTLRVLTVLFTMGLGDNLKVRAGLLYYRR